MAIDEEVDFLLIAGDLYDGDWKDYNTGLFFAGQMGRLEKAGIKVFIISGNHDAASQITKTMPLPGNVTRFSPKKPQSVILDDLGVIIHGQSYSTRAVTDNMAAQYPPHNANYFNIGLLHTALTGREGHEDYAPCTLDDLKSKGYEYWALGHIHKREVVSEDPMILFPGNIQGRHIKETGIKGATLVTVEEGHIVNIEERELDVLRWSICDVDLSECESKEAVYECVRSAMEKEQSLAEDKTLALRLWLSGNCPLHSELHVRSIHWTEEFRGIAAGMGNVWLEKVKFRTSRKTSLEEIVGEDTPLSGLLQTIEKIELGDGVTNLVPDLSTLKTKLPSELVDDDSLLANPSAEQLAELREEVREMLIARIIQHGGEG
jgi:DNA repair exonuclease SbcCD nuclease subunit